MRNSLELSLIALFLCGVGFGQVYRPENKARVIFKVMVSRDSISRFLYKYDIKNDKMSKEICDEFTLLLVDPLITTNRTKISKPTNKKWYIDGSNLGFISGTPASRSLYIPPENGLAPGDSIAFSFKSTGLPTITTYYARSFNPPLNATEYDSLLSLGYTQDQLSPDWRKSYYRDQTIAPNTNLFKLSVQVFLDTIVSYKHQSFILGWLKDDKTHGGDCNEMMRGKEWYNEGQFKQYEKWHPDNDWDFDHDWSSGIVEVLDKRLDKAKANLARKDSVKARRDLQIFVMEVEVLNNVSKMFEKRQQPPIMTSEAYALLKYNAEYLIDRLPERHGRGDEGERREKR